MFGVVYLLCVLVTPAYFCSQNQSFILGVVVDNSTRFEEKFGKCLVNTFEQVHVGFGENLRNSTVRVGVFKGEDYEYDCWTEVRKGKFRLKKSYSYHILTLLQDVLKFEIKFSPSSSWGYLNKVTNTWTGLTNLIATNETDMAICHWTATGRLPSVADFLLPTLDTTESFVYLPQNLPLNRDVFLEMFSRKLWPFFLLSIFLMVVSLRFSTSVHSCVRPDHEAWSWTEVILWAIAAVSQQSYSRHPRGSSCRTMFLIGYSITYLLYTGFAAGVTSLLALQGHRNQLHFDDIAHLGLNLLLNRDEFYSDFLEKFSKTDKDYSKLLSTTQYSNLKQIFSKIQRKNFVGLGSTSTLANYLRKKRDIAMGESIAIVPIPRSIHQKSFLIRKNFPHKHMFNYWILRLKENGLLDAGKRRYLPVGQLPGPKMPQWLSADLDNVFSSFVFLAGGWILSLLLLFGEIFWSKTMPGSRGKMKK